MNKNTSLTLLALALSVLMAGCSSDETSPFTEGGGSSSLPIVSDSLTLAADPLFPEIGTAGGVYTVGETIDFTIFGHDRFSVKTAGQTIFFMTEYGSIDAICSMVDGNCTATLVGDEAPPADTLFTVVAWTTGEESFFDANGNGYFDDGDTFTPATDDVDEPYLDINGNGNFDAGTDIPIDLDNSGATGAAYTPADGLYSGQGCAHSTLCSTATSVVIWTDIQIDTDAPPPP